MYNSYDFVVFLDADWNILGKRNRQHFLIPEIARLIEDKGSVLAIERPVCLVTGLLRQGSKFFRWLKRKKVLRQEAENLFVYTPFIFLHNVLAASVPLLPKLNRLLMKWQIKRLLHKLVFRQESLIVWIHHPYQLEDVGLVNERILVYDIFDDYLCRANGKQSKDLKEREAKVLNRADIVFVVSEKLLKVLDGRAKQAHIIANGVDTSLFVKAADAETEIPAQIAKLPHPIIGFVGKVAAWLDFKILAKLAVSHPKWSLVFIGMCEEDNKLSDLPEYRLFRQSPNVHLLGPKIHTSLPGYIKGFDVCIIPYRLEGQVPSSSPLKLYEYLATGKPIVSVDIPHVAHFKPLVRVARNADEFEKEVVNALKESDNNLRLQRLAVAQQNSWERRAKRVLEIIEATLVGKQS
ncbi:putative teichuronic acid biosynthesis glycosyltransferase TuaH [Candidatus Brocadiaceae bacterium B188]|nr:putative teichuronic acid biosynthesis glycosyltransferase TuaH [Candidatus Brocadiaceae bacterium B188]